MRFDFLLFKSGAGGIVPAGVAETGFDAALSSSRSRHAILKVLSPGRRMNRSCHALRVERANDCANWFGSHI